MKVRPDIAALLRAGQRDNAIARQLVVRFQAPRVQGLCAVATAEHLVHDRYMAIGTLYDTPSPNRGGG